AEEVFREVMKDKIFYDTSGGGLTVSGGEPSFQPEFTLALLGMAKEAGIGRAVESCGIGRREFYEQAADLGTTFLYDLKCMEPEKHKKLTGADNAHIIDNLLYLFGRGADVIIRMPLVPGCNDADDDILRLAEFLKEHEGKYRYAEIMPYHTMGTGKAKKLGEAEPFAREAATDRDIQRWVRLFEEAGATVRVSK
ncbi:MAG: radical SAM protein, partial [Clostridia bacterium]|nr:radical SAM protein [Clostridia bacterium]